MIMQVTHKYIATQLQHSNYKVIEPFDGDCKESKGELIRKASAQKNDTKKIQPYLLLKIGIKFIKLPYAPEKAELYRQSMMETHFLQSIARQKLAVEPSEKDA